MKSILVVLGTRPEAVKLAPVIRELRGREAAGACRLQVCSTAQHREMLGDTLDALEIEPDQDLDLMRDNQSLGGLFGRMAQALQPVLEKQKPDIVVVQGDTLTVMVASVLAFLNGSQVAHVEAGLRTNDKRQPFPEEVNRRLTGVVADHHFAPTAGARDALLREGVDADTIRVTGNTGIDTLFWMRERLAREETQSPPAETERIVLVTAHRRESFGAPLLQVFAALRDLADKHPDIRIIYPVHPNPNVREPAHAALGEHDRIDLIDPLPYPELARLLLRSCLVITDSGGLQEEAPSVGKPVLVLREKTERPEAVDAGAALLVGTDRALILSEADRLLSDPDLLSARSRETLLYGDGRASLRIVESLLDEPLTEADFTPRV